MTPRPRPRSRSNPQVSEDAAAQEAPIAGTGAGGADPGASPDAGSAELYGNAAASPAQPAPAIPDLERGLTDTAADARRTPDQVLQILAGGLLLTGLALVALRWASRRLA